jgi:NADPH:quinone reductase-like Zn-dependent oxidoreductase
MNTSDASPMRYWSFEDGFGLEQLTLRHGATPEPGPRDVVLEMQAASLNYRDLVVMRGQHGRRVVPPLIPLSDGVGRISGMGRDVDGFKIGDRVAPCFYQHWQGGSPPADLERGRLGGPLDGVLATHRVFPASGLVRVPDNLDDAEAATLPCAGVTAWSALNEPRPMRPGETVTILGTGGVALMALLLAKTAGCRTIVTTSSAERAARVEALGADFVIDRNATPDWSKAVREITGGTGCHRVLELGGAATMDGSVKAVCTGGSIILIGNVTGNTAELFLPLVLTRRLSLHSVSCGAREAFTALVGAIEMHDIKPVIADIFAFEDAPDAYRAFEAGAHFGNICIRCGERD